MKPAEAPILSWHVNVCDDVHGPPVWFTHNYDVYVYEKGSYTVSGCLMWSFCFTLL